MLPDPKAHGWAIVVAECLQCARAPNRHQRELAMLHAMTLREIADALNACGVRTARGGQWHSSTVHNLLARFANREP
jgi:hypothetical protein